MAKPTAKMNSAKRKPQPLKTSGRKSPGNYILLPLVIMLAVLPLLVRLHLSILSASEQALWNSNYVSDFFSYYKSRLLFLLAAIMLGLFLYQRLIKKTAVPARKDLLIYIICVALFAVFVLLATLFSKYPHVALWGAPERCEGFFVWLSYLIIFLYALWAYWQAPNETFIVLPLAILVGITTFLGIFQFWGHDIFSSSLGQNLIIPAEIQSQGHLEMQFTEGKIYGTMYHYNYMGSFSAMMAPFFLVLALFGKEPKQRIACGVLTFCSIFLLLGSTSRAGIIGVIVAVVCFLLFFAKKLVQHYKATAGCIAGLVLLVFIINLLTGGLALARVPSLIRDASAMFGKSSAVDYHTLIAVQDIDLQKDSITYTFTDGTITLTKNANGQPVFHASNGEGAVAPLKNGEIAVSGHSFLVQYATEGDTITPYVALLLKDNPEIIVGMLDAGFTLTDTRINPIQYVEAPSIGFQGKEKLGSARGYIWSRSLPLVAARPLLGYGPDTFYAVFPQGDLLGKLYAYGTTQMLVDKPHNLYLQIAISDGVPALIVFLVLISAYLVSSIRLYALKKNYSSTQIFGAAVSLAIIGYLGAGFFNDSIVSIAPIFWTLLGVGIATNLHNKAAAKENSIE